MIIKSKDQKRNFKEDPILQSSGTTSGHPCMITIGAEMGAARHFLRVGQVRDTEHLAFLKPTLHINLNHPIINALIKLHKSEPTVASLVAEQVPMSFSFLLYFSRKWALQF